jgi:DNA-binding LacI/PurR family transcriptional regulator
MSLHQVIAIIFSDLKNDYNDDYITGIQKQANSYGYRTFTFSMPQTSELYTNNEEWVYSLIDTDRYDGIIFVEHTFSTHKSLIPPIEKELYENCRCPVVVIGKSNVLPDTIGLENRKNFEKVVEHLIDVHGCRSLYCLGGEKGIADERIDGFINVLKNLDIPFDEDDLLYGGYWISGAEVVAKDIACGTLEKPDAIVCLNDEIAYALIKQLFFVGLRVPEDILVTGFDNSSYASNTAVSITTFTADTYFCGQRAMAQLHSMITGGKPELLKQKKHSVITGESCGCGCKKLLNVRGRLDTLHGNEKAEMEFRNSLFEEKLYKINSQEELSMFIKNHKYLIRNHISVSVNLMEQNDEEAECIFLKDYLLNGETAVFRAKNIYPDMFSFGAVQNVHILPLVFDKQIYGFMTIGYTGPELYTLHAKQFANRIAIGAEILRIRQAQKKAGVSMYAEPPAKTLQSDKDIKKQTATIMVMHNGSMTKVPIENILYFESYEKKVFAAMKSGRYEIKQRLFEMEEMLTNMNFFRISRSVLVNMNKTVGYKLDFDRALLAVMSDKEELRVSRTNKEEFKQRLERS